MGQIVQDLRYAIRTLRKSFGFAAISILALALGIGANTAIFSVVNAVLLRPLPYAAADRLVEILETHKNGPMSVAYPDFLDWRAQADVFEEMAIGGVFPATMTGRGAAERVGVHFVSANYLRTFGVTPMLGRDLREEDDRDGAAPVAILSYRAWQRMFGGDARCLGAAVTLDKARFVIAGVLPPPFREFRKADFYAPIGVVARQYMLERGNHDTASVVARLKPGVGMARARAAMETVAVRLAKQCPGSNTGVGARVSPLRDALTWRAREPVWMLLGAVALVLLIACVNVANLLLARSAARRKEIAVRAALGAGRGRLVRQFLTESVLLSGAGALLGLAVAASTFGGLTRLLPAAADLGGLSLDLRVLGFAFAAALATGILFGLAPAINAGRANLTDAMKAGGRAPGAAAGRSARNGLVVAQVSLAFVLLAGAGLLLRSFHRLLQVDPGFRSEHVLTMRVTVPEGPDTLMSSLTTFYRDAVQAVAALPGVRHAGFVRHLNLTGGYSSAGIYRTDRPAPPPGQLPEAGFKTASPGFFPAMGIPLLRGRFATPEDGMAPRLTLAEVMKWAGDATVAAVISDGMARKHWPGEDPIGKTFRFGPPEFKGPVLKVVGVVGDARQFGLDAAPSPVFYPSFLNWPDNNLWLVVRADGDPRALVSAIRRVIQQTHREAPVTDVRLMDEIVSASLSGRRANIALLGAFCALALVLAGVGVYGVMAYTVAQRTQEIGVRMALGASSGRMLRAVVGEALLLAGAGVALGAAAALGLTRLIASMLYGVRPADAPAFLSAAAVLVVVAVAAAWAPARRAMTVDPLAALRCE